MSKSIFSVMSRMIQSLAISALLLGWAVSFAQSQDEDFESTALGSPDGVIVLIGPAALHPSSASANQGWTGYVVYRKTESESAFTRVTPAPLTRPSSLREFEQRAGAKVDLLAAAVDADDKSALWNRIERNDRTIAAMAAFDPELREALGLLYRDREAKSGLRYTYEVAMVTADGRESGRTKPGSAMAGRPLFTMKGPLAVTAGADERSVELRWNPNPADTGAFGYVIYRADERNGRFLALNDRPIVLFGSEESKAPPTGVFTDTNVSIGRQYFYAVVSRDFAGFESAKEPVLVVEPRDTTPPAIPQAVTAEPSGFGITITWQAVEDADLAGYFVQRSASADGEFLPLNEIPLPPDSGIFEDASAASGTQYFYRVLAVDEHGNESLPSANGLATYSNFKPPMPPQGVSAVPADESIRISWRPNDEEDLDGYIVYRAESLDGELVQVSPLIRRDTTWYDDRDPHISPRGAYWYIVQAVGYSGAVSPFSAPVISAPGTATGPDAPLNLRGYQDQGGNRLFWSPPSDFASSGYHVERTSGNADRWERITSEALAYDVIMFTDGTARSGVEYRYRVLAVNDAGIEGEPSQPVSLELFTPPPLPPGGVMATRIPGGFRVAWDASSEPHASGYVVYRKPGKGAAVRISQSPLSGQNTFFEDRSAPKGLIYYSVATVDDTGREGERSEPVMVRGE